MTDRIFLEGVEIVGSEILGTRMIFLEQLSPQALFHEGRESFLKDSFILNR